MKVNPRRPPPNRFFRGLLIALVAGLAIWAVIIYPLGPLFGWWSW